MTCPHQYLLFEPPGARPAPTRGWAVAPEDVDRVTAVTRELTNAARRAKRLFLRLYPVGATVRFRHWSGRTPMVGTVRRWGGVDRWGQPTVWVDVAVDMHGPRTPVQVRASQILEVTPKAGE